MYFCFVLFIQWRDLVNKITNLWVQLWGGGGVIECLSSYYFLWNKDSAPRTYVEAMERSIISLSFCISLKQLYFPLLSSFLPILVTGMLVVITFTGNKHFCLIHIG
jgi:hypothetical protein